MPAFTQLCEKVNITVLDNTITLYPKGESYTEHLLNLRTGDILSVEIDYELDRPRLYQLLSAECLHEAGVVRIVHDDDEEDHLQYHDDNLSTEGVHYHAQFAQPIDEAKFSQIISVFVKYDILSAAEGKKIMAAYRQDNTSIEMPSDDDENLPLLAAGFFTPQKSLSLPQKMTELLNFHKKQYNLDEDHSRIDSCPIL